MPLGEGSYSARFVRRRSKLGRAVPIGEAPVSSGSWGRKLGQTTDASLAFSLGGDGPSCAGILRGLDAWRDELELYRETRTVDLVWAGPVLDVIAQPQNAMATVTARDLSGWFGKRRARPIVARQLDVAEIFETMIAAAFAEDDPGISLSASPTGILADWTIAASDLRMLDAELAELVKLGVDWTVAGREFFVGGIEIGGRLASRLVDEHFREAPQTRRSGAGQVNDAAIRGNNVQGRYGGPDESDGILLEGISDGQGIEDQGAADAAARSWWDYAHEPLPYLEGDNALDPAAPLEIQEMIPGLRALVDVLGGGVVPLSQELRLESLAAEFGPEGEKISIALQPLGSVAGAS